MSRAGLMCRAALVAVLPLTATAAPPPVSVGSSYGLYLYSLTSQEPAHDVSAVPDLVFDGVQESFQRTVTLAPGRTRNIEVQVDEEQFFQDGRWTVRIALQSTEDLFPTGDFAAHGLGAVVANPLDLTQPVRLLAAATSLHAGEQLLVRQDWAWALPLHFQADPWDGHFINQGLLASFMGVNGQGGNRLTFEMQLAPVPEPGTWALLLGGLAAVAWRVPRRRLSQRSCNAG
jgi:PEP-CTERM motif